MMSCCGIGVSMAMSEVAGAHGAGSHVCGAPETVFRRTNQCCIVSAGLALHPERHRGRAWTQMSRSRHAAAPPVSRASVLWAIVVFGLLFSGCLFPPVDEAASEPGTGSTGAGSGNANAPAGSAGTPPTGGEQSDPALIRAGETLRTGFQNTDGSIDGSVSAGGVSNLGDGPVRVTFGMPPRLHRVVATLSWVDQAAGGPEASDLDLEIQLALVSDEGQEEEIWAGQDNGGMAGLPDGPVVIEFDDPARLARFSSTVLTATISPDVSAGVDYEFQIEYQHVIAES